MSEFAVELESYLPEPKKERQNSYITIIRTPNDYKKVIENLPDYCTVYCRTLDGSPCHSSKCIGYCWARIHRGYITKKLMDKHRCLEKNCSKFQKIEDAPYWAIKEIKAQERRDRRHQKKLIAAQEAEFLQEMKDLTLHDFNFYPVAAELKNDVYEVRYICFEPVKYSHYLSLFSSAADGKKIHFTKIKTTRDRLQQIIIKHNIVKIPAPNKPAVFRICAFVKAKLSAIIKTIDTLWSKLWKKTTKKD